MFLQTFFKKTEAVTLRLPRNGVGLSTVLATGDCDFWKSQSKTADVTATIRLPSRHIGPGTCLIANFLTLLCFNKRVLSIFTYRYFCEFIKSLSLGDAGLQIESSTIQISSRPNWISDYDPNLIPTTIMCQRSRFQYKFDIFSIKVDLTFNLFSMF